MDELPLIAERTRQIISQVAGREVTLTEDILYDILTDSDMAPDIASKLSIEFDIDMMEELLAIYNNVNELARGITESGATYRD